MHDDDDVSSVERDARRGCYHDTLCRNEQLELASIRYNNQAWKGAQLKGSSTLLIFIYLFRYTISITTLFPFTTIK